MAEEDYEYYQNKEREIIDLIQHSFQLSEVAKQELQTELATVRRKAIKCIIQIDVRKDLEEMFENQKKRKKKENRMKTKSTRQITLIERLMQIDDLQAKRFNKLKATALEIATEGIVRHLKACAKMDVNPDASAVREIIDDALDGRRVFANVNEDRLGVAA